MSTQDVQHGTADIDDPVLLRQVIAAVDTMSTAEATGTAVALGLEPPSPQPGWELLMRFDDSHPYGVLTWVLVTEQTPKPDDHT